MKKIINSLVIAIFAVTTLAFPFGTDANAAVGYASGFTVLKSAEMPKDPKSLAGTKGLVLAMYDIYSRSDITVTDIVVKLEGSYLPYMGSLKLRDSYGQMLGELVPVKGHAKIKVNLV